MRNDPTGRGEPNVLSISGLYKRFGPVEVLRNVGLDIRKGTTTIIIGPSGSGKSTLLNCINLLELPNEGTITLNGMSMTFSADKKPGPRAVQSFRQQTGMVFQGNHLFPHLTALENVMLGPVVVKRQNKPDAKWHAAALLDKVGLGELAERYPHQLSGGQQQRVGIARAMSMEPTILLFDEPTSALDPELVLEVLEVMKALTREGMTLVIVTHELDFASRVADQVIFMDQGRIVEYGTPGEVIVQPRHERIQAFVRRLSPHARMDHTESSL